MFAFHFWVEVSSDGQLLVCLLTFSLMTPAESGLEMAKLTRTDTDTSLLNTNMSAASVGRKKDI